MAGPFRTLMIGVLGYEKLAVDASDYGALIGAAHGHKYAGSPAPSISADASRTRRHRRSAPRRKHRGRRRRSGGPNWLI
jgi:hypothetical protein